MISSYIPGLDVRDLLAVADGLDVVGGVGGVGAEQGGHPLTQAVTHCKVNTIKTARLISFNLMIIES